MPSPSRLRQTRVVFVRSTCAVALAIVGGNALSLPAKSMIGHYDFAYAIRGDRRARPAQVFDDGAGKVYFEARAGQAMPAVFVGKELALLVTQPEGQYFTARTTAAEFTLALGSARASVRRGDALLGAEVVSDSDPDRVEGSRLLASAASGLPSGVDFGVATTTARSGDDASADAASTRAGMAPARQGHLGGLSHEQPVVFPAGASTLRVEVREALSALVVRIGRDTAVVVDGRNDAGGHDALAHLRAQALRNALLARGVAAANISIRPDVDDPLPGHGAQARPHASSLRWISESPPGQVGIDATSGAIGASAVFDIAPADHDIAATLRRWAHANGYEVIWDVRWTAPVTGAMRVDAPTFLDAVQQVVAGLRTQGYPVTAQAYTDRVVRFTAAQ